MAINKEAYEKALQHFQLNSNYGDVFAGYEDELIFCAENGKKISDFRFWIRCETLLKEKLSFGEYEFLSKELGKDPSEVNLTDYDLLHSFRKHLEEVRGYGETYLDENEVTDKTMVVLLVKPGEKPELTVIDGSLESKQKLVGGWIEQFMPFEDEVAIICNEEGKLSNLPLNRAIRYEDGSLLDIMAGDFFVCYAPYYSSDYLSLPPEMIYKYGKLFEHPEEFFRLFGKVIAEPILESHETSFLGIDFKFTEKEGNYLIDFSVFDEDKCEDLPLDQLCLSKDGVSAIDILEIAKEHAAELSITLAYKFKDEFNKEHTLDAIISSAADRVKPDSGGKDVPETDLDI